MIVRIVLYVLFTLLLKRKYKMIPQNVTEHNVCPLGNENDVS